MEGGGGGRVEGGKLINIPRPFSENGEQEEGTSNKTLILYMIPRPREKEEEEKEEEEGQTIAITRVIYFCSDDTDYIINYLAGRVSEMET